LFRGSFGTCYLLLLRDLPIAAETAAIVASNSCYRVRSGSWVKVIEWLLLDRIYMFGYYLAIDHAIELPADVFPDLAEP